MRAQVKPLTSESLVQAADLVAEGQIVVIPTHSNYNLVGDATNTLAVETMYRVKKRGPYKRLPIYIPSAESLEQYAKIPTWVDPCLFRAVWPGDVAFVLEVSYPFPNALTCNAPTVVVGCTDHEAVVALTARLKRPIAATSANRSGEGQGYVGLQTAIEQLGDSVPLIIDGGVTRGARQHGCPTVNTIVDLTTRPAQVLRPGLVPAHTLARWLPDLKVPSEM